MVLRKYQELKSKLISLGYAEEIKWAQEVGPCKNALDFWMAYSWVVINAGMKEQIARQIWDKIKAPLKKELDTGENLFYESALHEIFGHEGKVRAIWSVYVNRHNHFNEFNAVRDKLACLESLPWIGPITKYHLAKNLGLDYCKPDRHLVRIAKSLDTTPEEMCARLSKESGDRIGTVDLVIWRAANLKLI